MPIFSYIYLRRKCRHCGQKISPAYPLIETACVLFVLSVFRKNMAEVAAFLHLFIGFIFIVIGGSDGLFRRIPNVLLIALLPLIVLQKAFAGNLALFQALLGGILGFLFLLIPFLVRPSCMGAGDVKMAGVLGMYIGVSQVIPCLGLSFVLAAIYIVPLLILRRSTKKDPLPMGVFLSAGALIFGLVSDIIAR